MRRRIVFFVLLMTFCIAFQQWAYTQPNPDCAIKGIIVQEEKRLYIMPGHKLYNQITVYPEKGERWFCSQQEAERAGFLLVPNPGEAGRRTQREAKSPSNHQTSSAAPSPQMPTPSQPEAPAESATEEVTEPNEQAKQMTESEAQSLPTIEVEETPEPPSVSPEQPTSAESEAESRPEQAHDTQPDIQREQAELPEDFGGKISSMQALMMAAPALIPALIVGLIFLLLGIICLWIIFRKADQPGWLSLIPFVNLFILVKISGKPGWWFLVIMFVPFIGAILYILSQISLAERFGKGALFGIGLIFLPMIFYPILAFGSAEYEENF